ncbi:MULTISPECIES: DUF4190 domain-containing protein [unclassified Saccharopolyspora]|uniref:DUF4190 domain-containing protein n=1 Tax=unclassified Saccharopolyspora TaxID=2646250 RepID=UPI001CD20DE0|nr:MULTISPECIES: DUF4190 domain-containing protein [unclassified Saccharopolyspora]MCA1186730.1 DUF4190 domain-containing protein [Saccharopolyspora sp. 6T]MCA1194583.1 DUF4190 domain-containing protein [Saccharopolyspora sp. 6V]MCA1226608.1 DUF4190 domain-containing protein [Saccharopolyspora sp. 6M]MCA1278329.1 DUF4190 domain-containing protein [Saccharopolyspora sp. 7B]
MAHSYDSHDVERQTDPRQVRQTGTSEAEAQHPGASQVDPRQTDTGQQPEQGTSWTTGAPTEMPRAKTSPMAVFGLVLGLLALLCGLTGVLAPLAIVFGIVGIVLGILGRKDGMQRERTGKGVATAGLIMAIIGLVLGVLAGIAFVLGAMNPDLFIPAQQQVGDLMTQVPR